MNPQSHFKTCTKCKIVKSADDFHKRAASHDGLNARCKACMKIVDAEKYSANKNEADARNRAYAAKNRARINELQRGRPYQKRIRNGETRKIWDKKYHEANPHMRPMLTARYRATKIKATPAWADPKKIEEFYIAADFLSMVTGEWYEVDHVIPLRSGLVCGLHWEGNLQVLTKTENARKGNRF